jgi:hypothetical protein
VIRRKHLLEDDQDFFPGNWVIFLKCSTGSISVVECASDDDLESILCRVNMRWMEKSGKGAIVEYNPYFYGEEMLKTQLSPSSITIDVNIIPPLGWNTIQFSGALILYLDWASGMWLNLPQKQERFGSIHKVDNKIYILKGENF